MNWRLIRIIDTCLGIPLIWLISLFLPVRDSRAPRHAEPAPKRILLVKFWGIGNIFMMLPAVQALRETYPDAELDFLSLESNRAALNTLGAFKRVATIDTSGSARFIRSWRIAAKTLAATGYDLAIDFDQFARFSALMTFHSGAATSIGFATLGQHRHRLYSRTVEYEDHIHVTRSFYELAVAAGVTRPFSADVRFKSLESLQSVGDSLLHVRGINHKEPLVVMHIGTSENSKERRWIPAHYAVLSDMLTARGIQVAMTGLPDEVFLIAETLQHIKNPGMVHDLGGKLSFTEYCALITVSDLVVSADTATIHIAAAVKTPAVGLYGPNSPHLYGPWGANSLALYAGFDCSPCITNFNGKLNTCRHPEGRGACMKAISAEMVINAIEDNYLRPEAPWRLKKLKVPTE